MIQNSQDVSHIKVDIDGVTIERQEEHNMYQENKKHHKERREKEKENNNYKTKAVHKKETHTSL